MAGFVAGPVGVSVPATSANLGPGFDALGIALSLRDEVVAQVTPGSGLHVEVAGAGAQDVPRDETNLVVCALRAACEVLGVGPPAGLSVRCVNVIPHGRGLGSSASATLAGIALARALVDGGTRDLDDEAMFALAADLEGHPDNVAAACYGGFVISGRDEQRWFAVRSPVDPRIEAAVFVPAVAVPTSVARGLLPASVPHADAAANASRAALLVAAMAGRPDLLHLATADLLHQDYREPAMPDTLALVRRLRAGGIAAVVSGAGPSVLVLGEPDGAWPGAVGPGAAGPGAVGSGAVGPGLASYCPAGWRLHRPRIDLDGVVTRAPAGFRQAPT